jgi:hypothetical protein
MQEYAVTVLQYLILFAKEAFKALHYLGKIKTSL